MRRFSVAACPMDVEVRWHVVSALDSRSAGCRLFEPSLCRRVDSLHKKLYFTLSRFTQVYKWVPTIKILWGGKGGGG